MADPINPEAVALIMRNEGCVLHTYTDSVGVLTCCYGHTGPDVEPGMTYTQAQAQALLEQDLAKFEDGVDSLLTTDDTSDNEYGAMVSLAYNVGLGNFGHSSVLRWHNAGNKTAAADSFRMWNRAGGQVLDGLTRRRAEESALYLKPDADADPALSGAPERSDKPGLIAWIARLLGALK